jgi:hypothetical protein
MDLGSWVLGLGSWVLGLGSFASRILEKLEGRGFASRLKLSFILHFILSFLSFPSSKIPRTIDGVSSKKYFNPRTLNSKFKLQAIFIKIAVCND